MKYVSLDLETTGLDPKTASILEFGAVIDDTEKPFHERRTMQTLVMPDPDAFGCQIAGDLVALIMNAELLRELQDAKKRQTGYCKVDELVRQFKSFLAENGLADSRITFAGKNFAGFDLQFLKRLPNWRDIKHLLRYLDPGSMYATSRDDSPPDTAECLRRAGLEPSVKHRALNDAEDICRLIRAKWGIPL